MSLPEELERVAVAAAAHGEVVAVLAAEPSPGRRTFLVAYGDNSWLVLDDAALPVDRRELVRATASIAAMCELAEDVAGGGNIPELRAQLAQLRVVEAPPGIEDAEAAALALERAVGAPPRVASPAYLDEVGAANAALERTLGDTHSAFANALKAGLGAVDEFVRDVETSYKLPLS